jgi:hypothetical protein
LAYLYREIKNNRGEWVKAEQMINEMDICRTNQPYVILGAGEIILARVLRYKGSILAECRLVMKRERDIVYSNVFVDYIENTLLE